MQIFNYSYTYKLVLTKRSSVTQAIKDYLLYNLYHKGKVPISLCRIHIL